MSKKVFPVSHFSLENYDKIEFIKTDELAELKMNNLSKVECPFIAAGLKKSNDRNKRNLEIAKKFYSNPKNIERIKQEFPENFSDKNDN